MNNMSSMGQTAPSAHRSNESARPRFAAATDAFALRVRVLAAIRRDLAPNFSHRCSIERNSYAPTVTLDVKNMTCAVCPITVRSSKASKATDI